LRALQDHVFAENA
jgi:hypothetical protein